MLQSTAPKILEFQNITLWEIDKIGRPCGLCMYEIVRISCVFKKRHIKKQVVKQEYICSITMGCILCQIPLQVSICLGHRRGTTRTRRQQHAEGRTDTLRGEG